MEVSLFVKSSNAFHTAPVGDAENARLENAGLELSAPNCRGGKCRTGNIGTI